MPSEGGLGMVGAGLGDVQTGDVWVRDRWLVERDEHGTNRLKHGT